MTATWTEAVYLLPRPDPCRKRVGTPGRRWVVGPGQPGIRSPAERSPRVRCARKAQVDPVPAGRPTRQLRGDGGPTVCGAWGSRHLDGPRVVRVVRLRDEGIDVDDQRDGVCAWAGGVQSNRLLPLRTVVCAGIPAWLPYVGGLTSWPSTGHLMLNTSVPVSPRSVIPESKWTSRPVWSGGGGPVWFAH